MILPSFLNRAEYTENKLIEKLNNLAYRDEEVAVYSNELWSSWRGIFEYIACVEFAKLELLKIPTGRELGNIHIVPAQYHSVSMVFFAQATLDSIVEWLCSYKHFNMHGSQRVFHKKDFKEKICVEIPEFIIIYKTYEYYIKNLEEYRSEWIHRITGGARMFSDDPSVGMSINIPIDPKIDRLDWDKKLERIEELKSIHGTWLYSLEEFSEIFADGLKQFVWVCLEAIINDHENSN